MTQMMKVSQLVAHPRNAEFFDDMAGKCWGDFLNSIKTSGVIEPIIATEDNVIISGHQRVRACKELGIEEIPVEVKTYEGDEKRILKDLIETNVRQRGTVGGSDAQIVARVKALDDWYGIQHGGNRTKSTKSTNGGLASDDAPEMSQSDILKLLGLTDRQYQTAKKITECTIPEVQQLIEDGTVSRRTVSDLIAKLSTEDQRKLVDALPEDVKLTAKSVEAYIDGIRAEGAKSANAVQAKNDSLLQQIDSLRRECNELRAGNLPLSEGTQAKLDEQDRKIREYYEKYQASESGKGVLRQMLDENAALIKTLQDQYDALKAATDGKDDGVVQMQCQIDELNKKLSAAENRAKGLEAILEERNDEILDLKQRGKDGALRAAVTPGVDFEEYSDREVQNYVSKIQIAIGNFINATKEILGKTPMLSLVDASMLTALGETSALAIRSGESLHKIILAAGGVKDAGYSEDNDEPWSDEDMVATGIGA